MNERTTFKIYADYRDKLKALPMVDLGNLFDAILQYVNDDAVDCDELSNAAAVAFEFIKDDLDALNSDN